MINLIIIAIVIFANRTSRLVDGIAVEKNIAIFEFAWTFLLFLIIIHQLAVVLEESEIEKSILFTINNEANHLLPIAVFIIIHLSIFSYFVGKYLRKKT